MLIKPDKKYIPSLKKLWLEVFGDEEEYIDLFFKKAYFHCDTFAEAVDSEIVSALYLLGADIKLQDRIYKGRYLYAAATLERCRSKGFMAKLINEAISFAEKENLDFIALVPANDGLYSYYERFAFKEAMYKYKAHIDSETSTMRAYREIDDWREFDKIRSSGECDMLLFDSVCNEYAFQCLRYGDTRVFYIDDTSYYADGEELFCSDKEKAVNMMNNLCGESVVYTNCSLENAEKIRNGMLYCLNDDLKNKEIYMNIALD